MPSTSAKQQRFMGAQLAKQRKTGSNSTGMSESQLHDFAKKRETRTSHGSLTDIEEMEENAGKSKLKLSGYLYEPGGCGHEAEKNHELLSSWEAREVKDLPDYSVDVVYHGPDTQYRAEELDMQQYGADYEPIPLRDYFKSEDHQQERSFRSRHQDEYDQTETPGAVTKGDTGQANRRTFDEQQEFARAVTDKKEQFAVEVRGIDTKRSKNMR